LERGSPAIDAGDSFNVCNARVPAGLGSVDQRGLSRFRDGDFKCDIGAFEFTNLLAAPFLLNFCPSPVGEQTPHQTITVVNNQPTTILLHESLDGDYPDYFEETGNTCGSGLAPHLRCFISIAFRPGATGARSAVLKIADTPTSGSADPTSP